MKKLLVKLFILVTIIFLVILVMVVGMLRYFGKDEGKLKVVETWKFEYDVGSGGGFVPELAEYKGKLFMYVSEQGKGIVSFSSSDGKTWTKDAGIRVANEQGLFYSHVYTAVAPDGKLYMFIQTGKQERGPYYVSVSESSDGLDFSQPNEAIRGEDFGGNHAAHGRIIKLEDGKYLLAVSAGYDPPDARAKFGVGSQLAYSYDLKKWNFTDSFFGGCHDPTFDVFGSNIWLYCQYRGGGILRFDSPDGYKWDAQSPVGWVVFLDRNGKMIDKADDIDVHTAKDGTTRMFISVHYNRQAGVWSMVRASKQRK